MGCSRFKVQSSNSPFEGGRGMWSVQSLKFKVQGSNSPFEGGRGMWSVQGLRFKVQETGNIFCSRFNC